MNKLLLLGAIIFSLNFYAQGVEWGEKQTAKNGMLNPDCFIAADGENYFVLSGIIGKSEVMTFDFNHKLIKSEPIVYNSTLKLKNKKLINTSNGIYMLMYAKIKEEKRKALFVSKFENGSFNKDIIELDKFNSQVGNFNMFENEGDEFDRTNSGFKISQNKEFVFLFKKSKKGFVNAVYNADFTLSSYTVIPYKELHPKGLNDYTEIQVDNNGDVVYTFRGRYGSGLTDDYWFTILSKDKAIQKIKIALNGQIIKDLSIANNKNNDLIAVGIFGEESKQYGTFTQNITQNKPAVIATFSAQTKEQMSTTPWRNSSFKIAYSFSMKEYIYVAIEQLYITKSTKTGKDGAPVTYETKHFNDIFIFKYDQDGKVVDTKNIKKDYYGEGSAVRVIKDNQDLFFIYNKHSPAKLRGVSSATYISIYNDLENVLEEKKALEEGPALKSKNMYYLNNHQFLLKKEEGLKSYYFYYLNLQ